MGLATIEPQKYTGDMGGAAHISFWTTPPYIIYR